MVSSGHHGEKGDLQAELCAGQFTPRLDIHTHAEQYALFFLGCFLQACSGMYITVPGSSFNFSIAIDGSLDVD